MGLLLLVVLFVCFVNGHICVISPRQRGSLNIGQPGDPSCFRRTPECGGQPAGNPTATYTAGSTVNVLFQQNLNHWSQFLPGAFDVSISYNPNSVSDTDFELLTVVSDFPAHEQVWQTNFTVPITIPKQTSSHAVLRFRYISNNPDEIYPANNTAAIFWQCSDIAITSNNGNKEPSKPIEKKNRQLVASKGCCAPFQFQAKGTETINGTVRTTFNVYWDGIRSLTRWDKCDVASGKCTSLYNNYTNGNEYVYSSSTSTCDLFGNDAFYGWCYGARAGSWMQYKSSSNGINLWQMPGNGFTWGSTVNGCYPASFQTALSQITFSEQGPLKDPSVFNPPAVCTKSGVVKKSFCATY